MKASFRTLLLLLGLLETRVLCMPLNHHRLEQSIKSEGDESSFVKIQNRFSTYGLRFKRGVFDGATDMLQQGSSVAKGIGSSIPGAPDVDDIGDAVQGAGDIVKGAGEDTLKGAQGVVPTNIKSNVEGALDSVVPIKRKPKPKSKGSLRNRGRAAGGGKGAAAPKRRATTTTPAPEPEEKGEEIVRGSRNKKVSRRQ